MAMWICSKCGETLHAEGGQIVIDMGKHRCKVTPGKKEVNPGTSTDPSVKVDTSPKTVYLRTRAGGSSASKTRRKRTI